MKVPPVEDVGNSSQNKGKGEWDREDYSHVLPLCEQNEAQQQDQALALALPCRHLIIS